jgi:Carboxypeptidase regulatory-like domain
MRKRLLAAVVPLLLMGFTLAGFSSDGSVLGVVTDVNGSVVAGASVTAVPVEEGGNGGDLAWVHTDNGGGFRLLLKPGRYVIRAKDEADGYPDPSFLLCSDPRANFPQVSVEGLDVSDVRVVLGTRGGFWKVICGTRRPNNLFRMQR